MQNLPAHIPLSPLILPFLSTFNTGLQREKHGVKKLLKQTPTTLRPTSNPWEGTGRCLPVTGLVAEPGSSTVPWGLTWDRLFTEPPLTLTMSKQQWPPPHRLGIKFTPTLVPAPLWELLCLTCSWLTDRGHIVCQTLRGMEGVKWRARTEGPYFVASCTAGHRLHWKTKSQQRIQPPRGGHSVDGGQTVGKPDRDLDPR